MVRTLPGTRLHLALLTVAFLAAGAAFAVGAPLFQAPDEPPHVDMVRHYAGHPFDIPGPELRIRNGVQEGVDQVGLVQGGPIEWPAQARSRPAYPRFDREPAADQPARVCKVGTWTSCQNYHYGHPPTYYVLMAVGDRLFRHLGFPIEMLLLRLLGVLLVAPLVPLTWYAATQVWPDSSFRPMAAATLVALFAPLAADAAAVNNDGLMLLCAGALVAASARLLRRPSPGAVLAVGLATGAGLLVKSQFQALTLAAAFIVAVAMTGLARRQWLGCIARFVVPVVVGSAWWLRNLVKFHTLGQPGGEILKPAATGPWNRISPIRYAVDRLGDLVGRFWGLYGQTAVETPAGWRAALNTAAVVLAVAGVVAWLARRRGKRPSAAGVRLLALATIPGVLLAGVLASSFGTYRRNGEIRGLLGRYLYPGLPVLAIGAVAAVAAIAVLLWRRPLPGVLLAAGTAVTAAFGLAAFMRAVHGFYGTRSLSLLLDRAEVVSAVPSVAGWLLVALIVWLGCIAAACYRAARVDLASSASRR